MEKIIHFKGETFRLDNLKEIIEKLENEGVSEVVVSGFIEIVKREDPICPNCKTNDCVSETLPNHYYCSDNRCGIAFKLR